MDDQNQSDTSWPHDIQDAAYIWERLLDRLENVELNPKPFWLEKITRSPRHQRDITAANPSTFKVLASWLRKLQTSNGPQPKHGMGAPPNDLGIWFVKRNSESFGPYWRMVDMVGISQSHVWPTDIIEHFGPICRDEWDEAFRPNEPEKTPIAPGETRFINPNEQSTARPDNVAKNTNEPLMNYPHSEDIDKCAQDLAVVRSAAIASENNFERMIEKWQQREIKTDAELDLLSESVKQAEVEINYWKTRTDKLRDQNGVLSEFVGKAKTQAEIYVDVIRRSFRRDGICPDCGVKVVSGSTQHDGTCRMTDIFLKDALGNRWRGTAEPDDAVSSDAPTELETADKANTKENVVIKHGFGKPDSTEEGIWFVKRISQGFGPYWCLATVSAQPETNEWHEDIVEFYGPIPSSLLVEHTCGFRY